MLYEALLVKHNYDTQSNQACIYDMTIRCNARCKRESKRKWIKHKHRDMFRGSSHCSTSPASHRRIFIIASTQDFSHREPPLRIWANTTRSTQLLSPTNTTYTLRGMAQQLSPLHLEGWALSQTTINLSVEGLGSKPTLQQSPLH